ncbi:MAG: hypothetical protein Q9217_006775 [Psora testacea]
MSSTWSGPAYAWHENVEDLERYGPGGYHPICLGDKFCAGRYEVIYKLGYGSFSTVWLCKDTQTQNYVSVKVAVSETGRRQNSELEILHALRNGNSEHPGKRFVTSLCDEFSLEGPNGSHRCFVFPVALNSIAIAKEASTSDNHMFAAPVARNLHTQNTLIQARQTKSWPLVEPYEYPERLKVRRYDSAPIGPNVPEYQIQPQGTVTPADTIPSDCKVLVTDFGEAFFMHTPSGAHQEYELNTPPLVRPLDSMFGYHITSAVDIWTMGMAIFDILGRSKLFQAYWPDDDTVVLEAINTFGPLPPKMWQTWPHRSQFFRDDGSWQEAKRPSESEISPTLTDRIRDSMGQGGESEAFGYPELELKSIEKMLQSMLQYEPRNRATVDQVLRSEWVREYGIPALVDTVPNINLSNLN